MANVFFLDSSALAKRYVVEPGTDAMNELLDRCPPDRFFVLPIGLGETISVFVRRHNAGRLSRALLAQALFEFHQEIVNSSSVNWIGMTDALVLASFTLILTHSINSTDAVLLRAATERASILRGSGDDVVVVASDQRLSGRRLPKG